VSCVLCADPATTHYALLLRTLEQIWPQFQPTLCDYCESFVWTVRWRVCPSLPCAARAHTPRCYCCAISSSHARAAQLCYPHFSQPCRHDRVQPKRVCCCWIGRETSAESGRCVLVCITPALAVFLVHALALDGFQWRLTVMQRTSTSTIVAPRLFGAVYAAGAELCTRHCCQSTAASAASAGVLSF
jgi:hypothetical protein